MGFRWGMKENDLIDNVEAYYSFKCKQDVNKSDGAHVMFVSL